MPSPARAALAALREKQAQQEQQLKQLDDERRTCSAMCMQLRWSDVAKLEKGGTAGASPPPPRCRAMNSRLRSMFRRAAGLVPRGGPDSREDKPRRSPVQESNRPAQAQKTSSRATFRQFLVNLQAGGGMPGGWVASGADGGAGRRLRCGRRSHLPAEPGAEAVPRPAPEPGAAALARTLTSPSLSNSMNAVTPASPRRRSWRLMMRV